MGPDEKMKSSFTREKSAHTTKLPINVADLRQRLGERRSEPIHALLPTHVVVQSRTTQEPVIGEVVIESIERGVAVTGVVEFTWEADCRRCLEIVQRKQQVEIDEIFQIDAPDDSDLIDFDGQQIDLLPVIRDAVVLSLPLAPLCDDGCAGPDPSRYPAATEQGWDSAPAVPDPRWAALDQLKPSES